jgi:Flp pilus assembly protein TadG
MRILRSENGQALIEFALLLLPLLLLLAYALDYAIWIQKAMQIQDAASVSAAYAAMPGKSFNTTQETQFANYVATGSTSGATWFTVTPTDFYTCSPGGATVTATTSCPTGAPYHYVKVTTSATPSAALGFRGISSSMTLTGSAIYRVEVTP